MARIRGGGGLVVCAGLSVVLFGGCPDEEAATSKGGASLVIPDRLETGEAVVLLRLKQGAVTTGTEVHRALGRLFRDQVNPVAAVTRAASTADPALSDAEAGGGTALQQVQALLRRSLVDGSGVMTADAARDVCGNPMLAAFVTSDLLGEALPAGETLSRYVSKGACASSGGCDDSRSGVWDVSLTEERNDGMIDAFLSVYPAVTQARPAFLGHLSAFFLTDANPGFWAAPLFVAADRINVSLQGLLQLDRRYSDRHWGDARTVYRFPHMERTLAKDDLRVTLLGDPLCDVHYKAEHAGAVPFGCKLADGRSLPVQLDRASELGAAVYGEVLASGKKTGPLEQVADALSWQVSAFLACPTFAEPLFVADGPVELFVCPDGDLDTCLGFHDMEAAGCAYEDARYFQLQDVEEPPGAVGGAVVIQPSDDPYRLVPDVGGLGDAGMKLTLTASAGDTLVMYSDDAARLTLRDSGGRTVSPTSRPNTHCGAVTAREWTLTGGVHELALGGDQEATVLLTRPSLHVPR